MTEAFLTSACVTSIIGVLFGVYCLGARGERAVWKGHAMTPDDLTGLPCRVDGEYYLVIPEKLFASEFQRREKPLPEFIERTRQPIPAEPVPEFHWNFDPEDDT